MKSTRQRLSWIAAIAGLISVGTGVVTAGSAVASASTLLQVVRQQGYVVYATQTNDPGGSVVTPSGGYEGFNIQVGDAIAKAIGVPIHYVTPSWNAMTTPGWDGRWDLVVQGMTITGPRQQYIHFSEPYNYIDAQFAASKASGITTIAGLKGKTICVGEATTYQEWIQGLLNLGTYQPKLPPPSRKFTTQSSDIGCAEAWQAGRNDAQGWLTASYTIDQAIKQGLPVVKLGQPVWAAPLAVAAIKSGPNPTTMIALVNKVLTGLYNSGQLGKWCEKWFGFNSTIPVKN